MSWFGKLFGTDTAVEKTIDTVKHIVDESFYTDEEEAAERTKARTEGREFLIRWLESTTGSRLARRVIALTITFAWTFLFLMAGLLDVVGVWMTEEAARLNESASLIDTRAEQMNGAVMVILGFYFAAPHLGDIAKGAMQKFGGGK